MNDYIKTTKELLKQGSPIQLAEILAVVYDLCEKRENVDSQLLDAYLEQIETHLEGMPFDRADEVRCAINAMCVEYDTAAFTDGFQKGAALILSLLVQE